MERWYKKGMRQSLIDMHIEDWNDEFFSGFDPQVYFENIKKANINAPMIYLQSHVGLCNWDTKSGETHPAFKNTKKLHKLFQLCHDEGMNPLAYYSIIFNNWAFDQHPEWRMRTIYGTDSRHTGSRYGLCCPNNKEYRQFVWEQMKEFCSEVDFHSIFVDMTFWPMICYCDSCKKRWEKEVGTPMPTVIDWNDDQFVLLQNKRIAWLEEFALLCTENIKKNKPHCKVTHQYSNLLHMWRTGVTDNVNKANDYVSGDLYGGIAEQSFACKLFDNMTPEKPFCYMTSRCYPCLSDHTTNKTIEMLKISTMLTYAHHGACMLIDAIDPIGTLNSNVYDLIGDVYREIEPFEKYLFTGKFKFDVAILFNLNGKMDIRKNKIKIGTPEENNSDIPHETTSLGAAAALQHNHIPYGVISNTHIEDIFNYKTVIISDAPRLSDDEMQTIENYILQGGNVYFSGISAQPLVEKIFGFTYSGYTKSNVTYLSPTKSGADLMPDFTKKFPMTIQQAQIQADGMSNGEILATITLPYTVPNPNSDFMDMGQFYHNDIVGPTSESYPFASIHSNPPGVYTELPAIAKTQYGKGTVIWSAAPFEAADRYQHKNVFANIIRSLHAQTPFAFTAIAPQEVECILFEEETTNEKLLTLVNLQDRYKPLSIHDITVSIYCDTKPNCVLHLPCETPVPFTFENNYLTLNISKFDLYDMYQIKF